MAEENLGQYVQSSLRGGKTREQIYQELLSRGVALSAIEEAFRERDRARSREDTQRHTVRIMLTIGVILVGAGIFSFIASNWQEMSRALKVTIIFTSMLLSYAAGWVIQKRGYGKTAQALFLLGTVIYGSGIFLIAQIFNIRGNWPDGFLWWMIGAIAFAFAVESMGHWVLAVLLGLIAIVGQPFYIFDFDFFFDGGSRGGGFTLTASWLLLLSMIVTALAAYLLRKKFTRGPEDIY